MFQKRLNFLPFQIYLFVQINPKNCHPKLKSKALKVTSNCIIGMKWLLQQKVQVQTSEWLQHGKIKALIVQTLEHKYEKWCNQLSLVAAKLNNGSLNTIFITLIYIFFLKFIFLTGSWS